MVKILHKFMRTFQEYIEIKSFTEADSPTGPPGGPPPGGGIGGPPGGPPPGGGAGGPPGGPPLGGGIGGPPMGGLGGPPPMGGPPMGGPPMGDTMSLGGGSEETNQGNSSSNKLKAYNVWDVLEKIIGKT